MRKRTSIEQSGDRFVVKLDGRKIYKSPRFKSEEKAQRYESRVLVRLAREDATVDKRSRKK